MSDFRVNFLQRVRFQSKNFTSRQISIEKCAFNVPNIATKFFLSVSLREVEDRNNL